MSSGSKIGPDRCPIESRVADVRSALEEIWRSRRRGSGDGSVEQETLDQGWASTPNAPQIRAVRRAAGKTRRRTRSTGTWPRQRWSGTFLQHAGQMPWVRTSRRQTLLEEWSLQTGESPCRWLKWVSSPKCRARLLASDRLQYRVGLGPRGSARSGQRDTADSTACSRIRGHAALSTSTLSRASST